MKPLYLIFLIPIIFAFSQCKSAKKSMKISKTIPLQKADDAQVYYQFWIAGVQGGGSGLNLTISKTILKDIVPVQVYFRKKIAIAEEKPFGYVARYKTAINQPQINALNMSANPKEEYGNKVAKNSKEFPFQLQDNEAVISYLQNNTTKYLKLTNISEKERLAYPSAPPEGL